MSKRKPFTISTVSAGECICDMPALEPCVAPLQSLDVLVASAGFEERVLAFPRRLRQDGATATHVLIGRYRTNESDNAQRYAELLPLLEAICPAVIEFDADDPLAVARAVEDVARTKNTSTPLRVAFEISGASSTLILSVLSALARAPQAVDLSIFYATAQTYDPGPQRPTGVLELLPDREEGISTGPLSEPFGGHHHDHLPGSVIALPSMYTGRLEACLAHLNVGPFTGSPDNLYWLLPSTGVQEHQWRQDFTRKAVEQLMLRLQGKEGEVQRDSVIRADDVAFCDVLDYADTMRLLIARIDALPGHNISIVHMGSKLQTIGVALAALARSEVAVLTVRPASFNAKSYSSGVGTMFTLRFAEFGSVLHSIASIGTLRVTCA